MSLLLALIQLLKNVFIFSFFQRCLYSHIQVIIVYTFLLVDWNRHFYINDLII